MAIITDTIETKDLEAKELNLKRFSGDKKVGPNKNKLLLNDELRKKYTEDAYKSFKNGLAIHDDLEAVYIKKMDFDLADDLANNLIDKLFKELEYQPKTSRVVHRLFGTNTPEGVVNVVTDLIDNIPNRYFVKGRAGTGKSTFMKRIANACMQYGLDLELYHCSFDPKSIDMVLIRDLDFCIFDSTDPHEFFPEREGDHIIDLYEETVTPGTDEKYKEDIEVLFHSYKAEMKKGVEQLKKSGTYLSKIENAYLNELTKEKHAEMLGFVLNEIRVT